MFGFQHHPGVLAGGNAWKITFDPNIEVIKRAVKRDEMRGLSRILSIFRDTLDKFNNTARLLGSIYCKTLKLLLNRV